MCGRYVSKAEKEEIEKEFETVVEKIQEDLTRPRYNIAPTQFVAVIRQLERERILSGMKWGLIPSWAKDAAIGSKMINARAETVAEKPAFRAAFKSRRIIVPASGFYEWKKTDSKTKQPFYFFMKEKPVFGFAGLWEEWTDKQTGDVIESYTIITTEANKVLEPVHERMPVILKPEDYELWLDPQVKEAAKLQHLLVPYPAEKMSSHAVGTSVNSPKTDSPELINSL
jgi:putative SOS response-associated peptidase YedK